MKQICHLIITFIPVLSFGQLTLGGSDPQELVMNALSGSGVSISNIQYNGSLDAIAYFSANTFNMPFQSGLLMTSGSKYVAIGPNNIVNAGSENGASGLALFNSTFGITSYDASVITFDFVPSGNTLRINYIFGSDEYGYNPSSSQFKDGFGIFISGPGIPGTQNIARLPNQSKISTDELNSSTNSQYFIYNGNGSNVPYNNSSQYLQYNGLSVPLTASVSGLFPGSIYHVIMVIADGGDQFFDSGVFLEEGGITASLGENSLDNFVSILYNASNQQATIQITEHQENLNYSVVDLSGKIMTQSKITETTPIDLSSYSSGMYLIRVKGNNGEITKKVIR